MKPRPIYKLKTIKSHDLSLTRPQTQHKKPEDTYLQFLTPQTSSVGRKTVNLYGFKYIYKQRNINVVFSQCES
jgi:hypothetical protein